MESSVTGLSAARQTDARSSAARRAANNLTVIFTGHCTPVERVQKGRLFAPAGLYAHVEVEIDLHAEDLLHLLPGERADLLEHRALGADDDRLLPIALD